MNKIGIIGGSFNPIHYGHLILAEQVRVEIGLSQVVFMPTYLSPFKQDTAVSNAADRLKMVCLATEGNPYFSVSQLEIGKEEVSYTAETLRQCKALLGEETELWFITGADAFLGMEGWHEADYLLSHFSLAIGLRPGFPEEQLDQQVKRLFSHYGTCIKKIYSPKVDISSSHIRELIAQGKSPRYLVPDSVLEYIGEKGLYRPKAMEYASVKADIRRYIEENLKESRQKHTEGVAQAALSLARRYGVNPEKAELCALFHDCRRGEGNLEHGPLAAQFMERMYPICDEDMRNAVTYHTTGRANMSLLEKVLYLADAIEPNRNYPGVEELRKLAYRNLNSACLFAMERSIQYVRERGLVLDENTVKARDFLEKEKIWIIEKSL